MDVNISNDELYHYGRKGMKWYQTIFTDAKKAAATRKRKRSLEKARDAKAKKREEEQKKKEELKKIEDGQSKKKRTSEMSDEELRKAIERATLEDAYRGMRPDSEPLGKRFASKFLNEAIIPGVVSAGKNFIEDALGQGGKKLLKGMGKEDTPEKSLKDKLTEEYNIKKLKKDIADLDKTEDPDDARLRKAKADKAEYDAEIAKNTARGIKPNGNEGGTGKSGGPNVNVNVDIGKAASIVSDFLKGSSYTSSGSNYISGLLTSGSSSSGSRANNVVNSSNVSSGSSFVSNVLMLPPPKKDD